MLCSVAVNRFMLKSVKIGEQKILPPATSETGGDVWRTNVQSLTFCQAIAHLPTSEISLILKQRLIVLSTRTEHAGLFLSECFKYQETQGIHRLKITYFLRMSSYIWVLSKLKQIECGALLCSTSPMLQKRCCCPPLNLHYDGDPLVTVQWTKAWICLAARG